MWLYYLVLTIHWLVCLFLVVMVLLQSGKAADLAGAFGGMGSQTTFGPRGTATTLSTATTVAAGVFMLTSLSLSVIATRSGGVGGGPKSILEKVPATAGSSQTAPQIPGQVPGVPATQGGQPKVVFETETGQKVGEQNITLPKPGEPGGPPVPGQAKPPAPAPKK